MQTFICRTWTGHQAELDAEADQGKGISAEEMAARNFAVGSFGDYPGEICAVWVADKAHPEVRQCIPIRIPDRRPFDSQEQTGQERLFEEWACEVIRDPQSLFNDPLPHEDVKRILRCLLEDADFTCEVEPGIVPIEIGADLSRSGETETFYWKLAGHIKNENGPSEC